MILLGEVNADIFAGQTSLKRAAQIAVQFNHHLFDTWYHAVALGAGATLVTADERYFNKAKGLANIVLLRDCKSRGGTP